MDGLSLFSGLLQIRVEPRDTPPFWDDDMRALYEMKLAEARAEESPRPSLAIRCAGLLERAAAWLRQAADPAAPGRATRA